MTTLRDSFTGNLTSMKWATPESWSRKLHTIQLDQIAAIVTFDESKGK